MSDVYDVRSALENYRGNDEPVKKQGQIEIAYLKLVESISNLELVYNLVDTTFSSVLLPKFVKNKQNEDVKGKVFVHNATRIFNEIERIERVTQFLNEIILRCEL